MKNFTLTLAGLFFLSAGLYAQRVPVQDYKQKSSRTERYSLPHSKLPESKLKFRTNSPLLAESIWKPKTEKIYSFDPEENNWSFDYETNYEYDLQGNVVSNTWEKERTLTRYDSHNQPVEIIKQIRSNDEWLNSEKTIYAYDDVVPDYRTETSKYNWNGKTEEWEQNYSHKKVITRNANNYVTRMSVMLYYIDDYDEIERTEITYTDGDLPATTWTFYQLDYDENSEPSMQEKIRYDKINWETSDGQILDIDNEFVLGNNKMKQAEVWFDGEKYGKLTTTFGPQPRDFIRITASSDGLEEEEHSLIQIDAYGSYKEEILIRVDLNEDGSLDKDEIMEQNYVMVYYDEHQNLFKEANYMTGEDGETEFVGGTQYLYTYGEHNLPSETIIQEWNYEEGKYDNTMKIEASDIYDVVASVSTIENTANLHCHLSGNCLEVTMEGMASYRIYNQNGMEMLGEKVPGSNQATVSLDSLPAGIYMLVVQTSNGTGTAKFIKR